MLLEIQRQHSQEREEKLRRSLERILPQNRLLFDTFGEKDPMKRPSMPLDDSQALTSSRGATNLTKTPKPTQERAHPDFLISPLKKMTQTLTQTTPRGSVLTTVLISHRKS